MKPTLTFNFNTMDELVEFIKKFTPVTTPVTAMPSHAPVTRYAKGYNGELPTVPAENKVVTAKVKKKKATLSLEDAAPEVAPLEEDLEEQLEEKSSISVKEITKDECRELLVQVSEKIGMPATLELLKDFGAKKFGEVPQDKYPEFKEKCLHILK